MPCNKHDSRLPTVLLEKKHRLATANGPVFVGGRGSILELFQREDHRSDLRYFFEDLMIHEDFNQVLDQFVILVQLLGTTFFIRSLKSTSFVPALPSMAGRTECPAKPPGKALST